MISSKHHETSDFYDENGIKELVRQGLENISILNFCLFAVAVVFALELLNYISSKIGTWISVDPIPVRGKHLDDFDTTDIAYIFFSRVNTAPFTYFYLRFVSEQGNVVWSVSLINLRNTVLPLLAMFILFDLTYTALHWFLHLKTIYPYIHKHHHKQKAPSRANIDAINVHPIEFILGEYNHLVALYICCNFLFDEIHVLSALSFLVLGGLMAGLNHTRFDFEISVPCGEKNKITIYDSKDHDVHHRIPQSNYGQYSMLWDRVFGTYRPYNANDRVNANYQLDPKTGKTLKFE